MKEFPGSSNKKNTFKVPMLVWVVLVVIAGIATGWFLSGTTSGSSGVGSTSTQTQTETPKGNAKEAGALVEGEEYEQVEGKLAEGGIDGEGTHHLVRDEKRKDQNVYLTSSTLDLQSYVGKNVKIWGITISGQKAGWLMEVGKLSVIN